MELFSTNLLKSKYENFKKNELLKVLECGLCMKSSCDKNFHYKFEPKCNRCKEEFCKNYKTVRISLVMFLKNTDEIGKDYLYNFRSDFLNMRFCHYKIIFLRWLIKQLYLLIKN